MSADRGPLPHRGRWRRWLLGVLAVLAVAVVALAPPPADVVVSTGFDSARATARGAFHIHSNRSDGAGSIDQIAAAASLAGLQFIILTDHGDGIRTPGAPAYRQGVLCIDGVELNTDEGHYVALDLPAAPYPLAGSSESVVEDVARLGGFGIVAHADSARSSLQWRGWDVPFDGLEWLNADSEWRDEPWSALSRAALTYWLRPPATLTRLLDRPDALIAAWDRLAGVRKVPVMAAADAHARVGPRVEAEPSERGWALPVPSYESSFRVFSNHVVLDRRFTGDAAADSAELLTAIRRGRMFTVIDGLAGPGAFEFTGTGTGEVATMGDDLPLIGSAQLRAQVAGPSGASLVLLRNGEVVKQETGTELVANVSEVGAYRVEVTIPGARLPWLFSNPIYLGFDRRPPSPRPSPPPSLTAVSLAETNGESSPGSINEFTASSDIAWHYRLGDGVAAGQYAAIRVPVRGLEAFTSVRFDVSSERPMRLWVQLRKPDGSGERWGRSVYSEQVGRTAAVSFDRLKPIGPTATERAALASVDSLLFVVDTVNTRPGSEGRVKLSNVALAR